MNETALAGNPLSVGTLRRTQPWIRFIAILMLIGTGLMVFVAAILTLIGLAELSGASQPSPEGPGGGLLVGLGIFYAILSVIYLFPGLFLLRAARLIRDLAPDADDAALADVLEVQRRFWKFVGITAIVLLVVYVLAIVAAVGLSLFAGLRHR